jgi:hypothetical protein
MPTRAKPSLTGGVILSLALLLIVLSFFRVYYIGGFGSCDFLWNEKEAFLFVHGERWGYNFSYLGYVGEIIQRYFGVIDSPDVRHPFTTVVRVTPSRLERFEEGKIFDHFTPLDGGLYADHDGELWKWADNHFQKVSLEEQRKLGGTDRLSKVDSTAMNGWSSLYSVESKIKEQFPIKVGGLPVVVKVKDGQVSIDLSPPGQPPQKQTLTERLYYSVDHVGRVSEAEYERVFDN